MASKAASAGASAGTSVVVIRADTNTLIYYACVRRVSRPAPLVSPSPAPPATCAHAPHPIVDRAVSSTHTQSECRKTLDKKLRPGPGGRLAATEKYATCAHCRKEVLPRPTFMLPLVVVGLRVADGPVPQKLIALDETAARLLGCSANEFIRLAARQPSLASLVERLLEGRRFWVRTKENKKRKQRQGQQEAAAIITELLSLEPAPPLIASASALLRGQQGPAATARAVADSDDATAWVTVAGGARLAYKFHAPAPAGTAGAAAVGAAAGAAAAAPSSPPAPAAVTRPSRVFDDPGDPKAPQQGAKRRRASAAADSIG